MYVKLHSIRYKCSVPRNTLARSAGLLSNSYKMCLLGWTLRPYLLAQKTIRSYEPTTFRQVHLDMLASGTWSDPATESSFNHFQIPTHAHHSPQVNVLVSRAQCCAASHATQKANHLGSKWIIFIKHDIIYVQRLDSPLQHKWLWRSLISCPLKTTSPNCCLIYSTAQMQMRPPSTGRCSRQNSQAASEALQTAPQSVRLLQRSCNLS